MAQLPACLSQVAPWASPPQAAHSCTRDCELGQEWQPRGAFTKIFGAGKQGGRTEKDHTRNRHYIEGSLTSPLRRATVRSGQRG